MQGIVEELEPQGSLVGTNYLPMEEEVTDETVWDVVKSGNGIGSLRAYDAEAKVIGAEKYDQVVASITDMADKRMLSLSDIRVLREAGENPYRDNSMAQAMAQRAERKVTKELARLRRRIENRLEWLQINALQGEINYSDSSRNIEIALDYGVPAGQKGLTPSIAWSDYANSDPISDIQTWLELVIENTGVTPQQIMMSRKNLNHIARNDIMRGHFQYTNPTLTAQGVREFFSGDLGLDIVEYEARYHDDAGALQRFLAEERIIMLPDIDQMNGTQRFGDTAYTPHPHNNYTGSFYAFEETKTDPWGIEVGVGLTALPRIYQPSVILTADTYTP